MYPAFDWSVLLRATMDISAHAISLADRPRPGQTGHQCSHAPGRPILHLFVSSRRPRRVSRPSYLIACSSSGSVPLFVLPSSRPARGRRRRAQEPSRPAVVLTLQLALPLPGRALTAPSTATSIKQVGRSHRRSSSSRSFGPWRAPPRRCGRACWQARSRARCDASASCAPRSRI